MGLKVTEFYIVAVTLSVLTLYAAHLVGSTLKMTIVPDPTVTASTGAMVSPLTQVRPKISPEVPPKVLPKNIKNKAAERETSSNGRCTGKPYERRKLASSESSTDEQWEQMGECIAEREKTLSGVFGMHISKSGGKFCFCSSDFFSKTNL